MVILQQFSCSGDKLPAWSLGLLLVFLVLVYVYPLKILFGGFFHWINGGWIPQVASIHSVLDLKLMFIVYGIAFSTLSLLIAALYRQALRAVVTPPLDTHELHQSRVEIVSWRYSAVVAVISMAFAMLLPDHPPMWLTGMPGMVYGLRGFTGVVVGRVVGRVTV